MSSDIAANEIHKLRNEIARLNGQTNWVCKCGGTDCEGQRENAALREDKARLDWFINLDEEDRVKFCRGWYRWTIENVKAEIDTARKEAQP